MERLGRRAPRPKFQLAEGAARNPFLWKPGCKLTGILGKMHTVEVRFKLRARLETNPKKTFRHRDRRYRRGHRHRYYGGGHSLTCGLGPRIGKALCHLTGAELVSASGSGVPIGIGVSGSGPSNGGGRPSALPFLISVLKGLTPL